MQWKRVSKTSKSVAGNIEGMLKNMTACNSKSFICLFLLLSHLSSPSYFPNEGHAKKMWTNIIYFNSQNSIGFTLGHLGIFQHKNSQQNLNRA